MLKVLLYRRSTVFQHLGKRGDGPGKLKVVIRYSWALDYNGIEGPQIAKGRKGFEIIMQLEKARTENHNPYGSFWWCTRDHSHENK